MQNLIIAYSRHVDILIVYLHDAKNILEFLNIVTWRCCAWVVTSCLQNALVTK